MTDYTVQSIFRDAKGKELRRTCTFKGLEYDARSALGKAHRAMATIVTADPRIDSISSSVVGGGETISTVDYADELDSGRSSSGLMQETFSPEKLDGRGEADVVQDALGILSDEQKEALANSGKAKEVFGAGVASDAFPGGRHGADSGLDQQQHRGDPTDPGGASVDADPFRSGRTGQGRGTNGPNSGVDAENATGITGTQSVPTSTLPSTGRLGLGGASVDAGTFPGRAGLPGLDSQGAAGVGHGDGQDYSGHSGDVEHPQSGSYNGSIEHPSQPATGSGGQLTGSVRGTPNALPLGAPYQGNDIMGDIIRAKEEMEDALGPARAPISIRLGQSAHDALVKELEKQHRGRMIDGSIQIAGVPVVLHNDPNMAPIQIEVGRKGDAFDMMRFPGRTRDPFVSGIVYGKEGLDPRTYGIPTWLTPPEPQIPIDFTRAILGIELTKQQEGLIRSMIEAAQRKYDLHILGKFPDEENHD